VVFDLIVPVPPSRKRASYQPVVEIATAIGARIPMPVNVAALTKIKDTPELKNVFDYNERIRLLQNAFGVDRDASPTNASCLSTTCIVRERPPTL